MEDLKNEAEVGSEDIVESAPLSIRDSLKASFEAEKAPVEPVVEKARDEAGRFATKQVEAKASEAPKVEGVVPPEAPIGTPEITPPVTTAKPPVGWSAEAKAKFETLPPDVQAAISTREEQVNNGFKVLQDYKGLEEFTPLVRQAGTTHAEVMKRAIGWEHAIKTDPENAIMFAAKVAGLDITINGKAAPQQAAPAPQPQPVDIDNRVEQALRKRDTENQISAFLSDPANPHAEAVMDDMVALISTGRAKGLQDAYDAACWMRPDIRAQLINQSAPAPVVQKAPATDQARRASKSITGSSAPGPSPTAAGSAPSSIRDSLKEAFAQAGTRA